MAAEAPAPRATRPLQGKRILLGLTGSSAVYRSIDLARELIRMGAEVRVVATRAALKLIGEDLIEWATGSRPYVEASGRAEHINLAEWADLVLVAPATLNTMAKVAAGVADSLLPLTAAAAMGAGKRVVFVPAMNAKLFNSPQYGKASRDLESMGAVVLPPLLEEGKAKFPPVPDLAHCVDAIANRGRDLEGRSVLVTAGATLERIDPVRVITNPSSGLMGILLAREAACRGARVVLVHGRMLYRPPYMVEAVYAETTEEMARAVEAASARPLDAAIFAGAPADYAPATRLEKKASTRETPRLVVELEPTPKVIKRLAARPRVLVGFAAEVGSGEEIVARAMEKMEDYGLDAVVAHDASSREAGFSKGKLDWYFVTRAGAERKGLWPKEEVARFVVDFVSRSLGGARL